MKKICSFFIIALAIAVLCSCGKPTDDTASSADETTAAAIATTESTENTAGTESTAITEITSATQSAATTAATTAATAATTGGQSVTYAEPGENEMLYVPVGEYVTLVYNPAYCSVEYSVQRALGSKETVSLSITMCEGYKFDGWSQYSAIANGDEFYLTDTENYTFTASTDVAIYANYSATLIYHANGGMASDGGNTYTQTFSIVMYKCPNTLPDKGYITRDGYTLSEYNTNPDGSGYAVSAGSRVPLFNKGTIDLYCIWEKQNDASEFTYEPDKNGLKITGYRGSSVNVVVPEKINGLNVITIGGEAFSHSDITRVLLPKTVITVEDGAFAYSKLEEFVFFDYLVNISDDCFTGSKLKHIRINSVLDMYSISTEGNNKIDRLLWAATSCPDKKKMITIGGSGTLYGFDCDSLDAEFGDEYIVINLGINANITSAIYFEYMRDMLSADDIILWAPEAGEWVYGRTDFMLQSWIYQAGHYDIFKSVDVSKYTKVFYQYSYFASSHRGSQQQYDSFAIVSKDKKSSTYGNQSYNQYGDCISVRAHNPATYDDYKRSFNRCRPGFMAGDYAHAAAQVADMTSRGIKFWLIYAAMDEVSEPSFDVFMNEFTNDVLKYFVGSEVISDYHDMLVPDRCMSDSAWHMTLEGAYIRTQVVIRDLKAKLGR